MKLENEFDIRFRYSDSDRRIWEEELEAFVPRRIYDAHMRVWAADCLAEDAPGRSVGQFVDMPKMDELNRTMFPGRQINNLVLGTPWRGIGAAVS